MAKLKIFCVTNKQVPTLENSNFVLCGVGQYNFNENYIKSNHSNNIIHKEKHYSELTFHYWYWKNLLEKEDAEWIGFCQRRRLWIQDSENIGQINNDNISHYLLKEPIIDWNNYNSVLCKPINISGAKKIKMIKRGWRNLIKNPKILFNSNLETINFHFDINEEIISKANCIMTDVFTSMNDKEDKEKILSKFQVNDKIMSISHDKSVFMHCLPAKIGSEVTEDVIKGKKSIVLTQAKNRLVAQKGILKWLSI